MERLRRASVQDVVVAWLRAERDSPSCKRYLRLDPCVEQILENPNPYNADENLKRWHALGERAHILKSLPGNTEWWLANLTAEDLAKLRAWPHDTWVRYSDGTRGLLTVAEAIRDDKCPLGETPPIQRGLAEIRDGVVNIYRGLKQGGRYGELVVVAREWNDRPIVIEGTKRATALCWHHCLEREPVEMIFGYVGISAQMPV